MEKLPDVKRRKMKIFVDDIAAVKPPIARGITLRRPYIRETGVIIMGAPQPTNGNQERIFWKLVSG
jgi:hypothetical protein